MPEPEVTVVIPCRNEERTIARVLADLAVQDLGRPFEVVIADGCSIDGTREAIRGAERAGLPYPLRVVDNVAGHIPGGLNAAVAAAAGRLIVRVDGHCRLPADYLSTLVAALDVAGQDVVGPRIEQVPGGAGAVADAIARLLASPFGTGGTPSRGRIAEPRRVAHTVMSCYRREVWARLGGYDELLLSNEDFDFDYRAGRAGFGVISLPAPTFRLLARAGLPALARQRWRYGWWKAAVLRRFPGSLHLRQAVPPLAVLAVAPAAVLAPVPTALVLAAYVFASLLAGAAASRGATAGRRFATTLLAPPVFAVIHGVWAIGLIAGLVANHPGRGPRAAGAAP